MLPSRVSSRDSFVTNRRATVRPTTLQPVSSNLPTVPTLSNNNVSRSQVHPFHSDGANNIHNTLAESELPIGTVGSTTSSAATATHSNVAEKTDTAEAKRPNKHHFDVVTELEKTLILADRDNTRPWWSYVPQPLSTICFEHRIRQLLLLTHEESKAGLINELSTHILIDCLFLTITATPLYSQDMAMNNLLQIIVGMLFYVTFHMELLSILLNGILIFAVVEIPSNCFRLWAYPRVDVFLFVARLHTCGLYLFIGCAIIWPVAFYEGNQGWLCFGAALTPWIVTLLYIGSTVHSGIFDTLNPFIKLPLFPKNENIRSIAEYDGEVFRQYSADLNPAMEEGADYHEIGDKPHIIHSNGMVQNQTHPAVVSSAMRAESKSDVLGGEVGDKDSVKSLEEEYELSDLFEDINLSQFLEKFEEEKIDEIQMLFEMDHEDFRRLGMTIGDRIRVLQAASAKLYPLSRASSKRSSKADIQPAVPRSKQSKYNVHIVGRRVYASSGHQMMS